MKLLFFSPYFPPYLSGLTTYPFLLLRKLASDYQISVLTFKHDRKLKNKEKLKKLNIIRMPYLFKISKGFISIRSLFIFIEQLLKTDLVFLNLPNAEGLPLAWLAKLFKKKIIALYHCQVTLGDSFWEKLVEKILRWAVNQQLVLADKVVFYTKDYYRSLNFNKNKKRDKFSLPIVAEDKVNVNYLDKLISKKQNFVWIGFAGRTAREKGIEHLIKALSIIRTNKKIKLVLAGPYGNDVVGEESYYHKLTTLLKKHKLNYQFFGSLNNRKLAAFYKVIDVLVLPSINQTEAFGMVQVEAMLAGTPVIASNLPGVRQAIKLSKMGKLVKPGDHQVLAQAIREVLKNKKEYTNNRLLKRAHETFNQEKVIDFWKKELESLSS